MIGSRGVRSSKVGKGRVVELLLNLMVEGVGMLQLEFMSGIVSRHRILLKHVVVGEIELCLRIRPFKHVSFLIHSSLHRVAMFEVRRKCHHRGFLVNSYLGSLDCLGFQERLLFIRINYSAFLSLCLYSRRRLNLRIID